MKKITAVLFGCSILMAVFAWFWHSGASADVNVNCEPVPGTIVPTNFTGTAPATVVAGGSFALKNITSSAANNLPVTITSSDLKLSATNASQTSYFKANTSSYVDSATGYKRAVFPDWQLSATGSPGEKVVIKLVEATAHIQGVGPITCPLSATLATINIASANSGSGNINTKPSGNSGDSKASDIPSNTEGQAENDQTADKTQPGKTGTQNAKATNSYKIVVKDEKDNLLGGARVLIGSKEITTSYHDGSATFEELEPGQQIVKVSYGNTSIERSIYVTTENEHNSIYVVIPTPSKLSFGLFFASITSTFTLASVFATMRFL